MMEKRVRNLAILGGVLVILVYSVFFMWALRPLSVSVERETVFFEPPENSAGTCSDGDYGVWPSTASSVNSNHYNFGQDLGISDSCFNTTRVIEYSCLLEKNMIYRYQEYDCINGCDSNACASISESHVLRFTNFVRDFNNGIDYVDVEELYGGGWHEVATDRKTGDLVYVGDIILTLNSVGFAPKIVDLSWGNLGNPWVRMYDARDNILERLPVLDDVLGQTEYTFNILDRDGAWYPGQGPIQEVTAYWQNGELKLNYNELSPGKQHDFTFEVVDNYLQIKVPMAEGNVVVPVLYGDGNQFTGIGKDSENKFAAALGNDLIYDSTAGDKMFVVSRGSATVTNGGEIQCESDVVAFATECLESESRDIYYLASDDCISSLPANWTYEGCDYNGNGIIGFEEDIDVDYDLTIYENGALFDDSIILRGNVDIEFVEDSDTRVDFEFNFSESELDFTKIFMRKQNDGDDYGYLIVNGINAGKTFYVDSVSNSSDSVCVKEAEIDDIDDISSSCLRGNEVIVKCNGTNVEGYTCTKKGGDYVVTGLNDSAVREFEEIVRNDDPGDCTPDWSCTLWGSCSSGTQERVCTDLNGCGVSTGKPEESKTCQTTGTGSKSCNQLGGDICGTGEVCDVNTVDATDGDCCISSCVEEGTSPAYFWVIFSVLILAIIVVVVMIILSMKNSRGIKKF